MEYSQESNIETNSLLHYTCEPWNISIVSKSRRGQRLTMEDRVWFEPPIKKGKITYIQCCIIDGHSTFPLELESFLESCKKQIQKPFDDSLEHQKEWQELVQSYESNWSSEGGVVCHLVSIQCSNHQELKCVRYQIGDCNSMMISQNGVEIPPMYIHNISQLEEFERVLPYLKNGRVKGVLACTRVIGNTLLKESIPESILDPIWKVESTNIHLESNSVLLCGTDGIMGNPSCIKWFSHQSDRLNRGNLMRIANECLERSGDKDNVGFIVIEFQYLKIRV